MTNKPTITVTPDDGSGKNGIRVVLDGEELNDNRVWFYAIERIAELEKDNQALRREVAAWRGK